MKPLISFFIISLIVISGCAKTADKAGNRSGDEGPDEILTDVPDTTAVNLLVVWVFDTKEVEPGNPQTDIKIQINQGDAIAVQHGVGEYREIDKTDYERYSIPADAMTACGGFWAGFLHVMYVKQEGDTLIVMDGGQDEGAPALTFREVKRLPIK